MEGRPLFRSIPVNHWDLGYSQRYCVILICREVNLKSYLLRREGRPTSPSSGQASICSQLLHPQLLVCHSRAALYQAAARQIQQPKIIIKLSIFARSTPLQIRLPALQRCRLNTSYNPFEAVRAIEQALLPTIEANRKGNLKNERTCLLCRGPLGPRASELRGLSNIG